MSEARIVVVGSSNTDMVVQSRRIPAPGETILGGKFVMAAGGTGANQAVAAARLGASVTFVARVGNDVFGRDALANFEKEGIDTRFIAIDPAEPSGVALIMVDEKGENCISVAPGANSRLSPDDVRRARSAIEQADVLLVQLEIPLETVEAAAELAAGAGTRVVLNPAPAQSLPERLLRRVDVLTPNETEATHLAGIRVSGEDSWALAACVLRQQGVETVVITRGAAGAFLSGAEGESGVPTAAITPVDTTGAGDSFNAALAVALAEGRDMASAVRFANLAGACSATRLGAQPSLPTREDLDRFIASCN